MDDILGQVSREEVMAKVSTIHGSRIVYGTD